MVLGKLPVPGRPTIWITVGQGPTALAVGAGGGCLDIFTLVYPFSPLSPSLWETARYRLKYYLKGPLNPKQPTYQPMYQKTATKSKKAKKPWFTEDCKTAIKQRKGALRQFNNRPTHDNLNNYRIFRAKARRTIKESKKKSWKQYVSKLNSRTSINKVWDMVRKIQGKGKSSSLGHLNVNNEKVTSKKDISNTLADAFSKNSSSENYTQKFKNIKQQK